MPFGRNGQRKKRLQYDPPGSRARKKANRAANRRVEALFITRRALLFKSSIAGAFSILLARLGYMQIGKGRNYEAAATTNVTDWRELKPPRGLIVDRKGRPLASNRKSWSVSVIPADIRQLGPDEQAYVKEQLVTALHLPNVVMINPGSIPANAKEQVYRRCGRLLGDVTDEDYQNTQDWVKAQLRFNDYAVFEEITADQEAQFNTYRADLPGVEIVNYFDYVVRNFRFVETPFLLKSDITREVAMKLSANQLYLPGVVLDDNVLTRSYEGGPTMSHILGFAAEVNDDELNDESNIASIDENGNRQYRYYKRKDIIGKQGLELYYEQQLRGNKGGYLFERDANGRELRRLTEGAQPAVAGRNLRLTIDLELQAAVSHILRQELPLAMERRQAEDVRDGEPYTDHQTQGGAVVMLDVRNGEVLAMASYPTYDNTLFVDGISERKYGELINDPRGPLYDKCYMQRYPPGSILKPFMSLTGLREGVIDANTTFTCGGGIRVPWDFDESKGDNYGCWNRNPGHGVMNLHDAIVQSCDVYFYNVGVPRGQRRDDGKVNHYSDINMESFVIGQEHSFGGLGISEIHSYLTERFWFGHITGIDLPSETGGLIGNDEWKRQNYQGDGWSIGDTVHASIGQGYIETSPLQMAVNVAALGNGGKVLKPRIVDSVVDSDGNELQEFETVVKRRLKFDQAHWDLVLTSMKDVVHNLSGTAFADAEGNKKFHFTNPPDEQEILIAGKTGTAEFGRTNEAGESYNDAHAWFTCYAPFDKPEVAIAVFVESGGEGSTNAVPIADKALRAYLELTNARKRGLVLREDGEVVSDDVPSPLDDPGAGKVTEETPEATTDEAEDA